MTELEKLNELCCDLNLSVGAINAVRNAVIGLGHLQRNKNLFKSGTSRAKEMGEIIDRAKELYDTLQGMDIRNDVRMQTALGEAGFPGQLLNPNADERAKFNEWNSATRCALEMIVKAATDTQNKIPKDQLHVGRTSTRHLQAIQLSNLDRIMELENGPRLARNGPFQRLSDAIFSVAGVPAKSEGTIQFLLDWRADTKTESNLLWDY